MVTQVSHSSMQDRYLKWTWILSQYCMVSILYLETPFFYLSIVEETLRSVTWIDPLAQKSIFDLRQAHSSRSKLSVSVSWLQQETSRKHLGVETNSEPYPPCSGNSIALKAGCEKNKSSLCAQLHQQERCMHTCTGT